MKNILKNFIVGCVLSILFSFQVSAAPNIDGIISINEWNQTDDGYIRDFGIRTGISDSNVDLTLNWSDLNWNKPTDHNTDGPFSVYSSQNNQNFENKGFFKSNRARKYGSLYTIDSGINLDELSYDLASLFDNKTANGPDQVMMHYTMTCGNDLHKVSTTYDYSQPPEPTTLFLVGIGLLGLGAFGKRKTRNKI